MKTDLIQDDLLARLQKDTENLRSSALKLNKASAEYRSTLSLIDEKIIYLAAGTISLFLTFLGILFNTSRDTSNLRFSLMFLAIFGFLATIIFLLAARWFWSLYVFSISRRYYLEDLKTKYETELQLMNSSEEIHSSTTFTRMGKEEMGLLIEKIEKSVKNTEKQIDANQIKEKRRSKWAKNLALLAYTGMVLGYVLATLFFMDLVNSMMA